VRTLYSITFVHRDGGATVVDYLAGRETAGWFRHELDAAGRYLSVSPAGLSALRPLEAEGAAPLALELRKAAGTMDAVLHVLRGPGADRVRRDRREVLERLGRVPA